MAETLVNVVGWQRPTFLVLPGLLGVERTVVGAAGVEMVQTSCWVLREQAIRPLGGGFGFSWRDVPGMALSYTCCRWVVCGAVCGVVGWLFVEICIVDASIFVVKLSRADGGCLGTRSR